MGSSTGWALALGQVGKGLLEFGQNRETLRYQRERDAHLAELQKAQTAETSRHNTAMESHATNSLTEQTRASQADETLRRDALTSESSHRAAMLANDNARTANDALQVKATIKDLGERRKLDSRKADLEALESAFVWNKETGAYEQDPVLLENLIKRETEVSKARYSGMSSNNKGAWETEYSITLDNIKALKNGGDPRYANMSDAQMGELAREQANLGARRDAGTHQYESVETLRDQLKQLSDMVGMETNPERKDALMQQYDDVARQLSTAITSPLLAPPTSGYSSGAATGAGDDYSRFIQRTNR